MKNILSKFKVDNSTYLLILFAFLAGYLKNISIILVIVIIHEFGHILFFKLFNIEIIKIVLYPFGGMTYINKRIHTRVYKDILISLGGIIFQIILLGFIYCLFINSLIVYSTFLLFFKYNLSIIVFNLVPIIPLDGSKLFFAFFTKFFSFKKSYRLMVILGFLSFLAFIFLTFSMKLNDFTIYLFLFLSILKAIRDYNTYFNKFCLERILYDNYYDEILSGDYKIDDMKINKYYYFERNQKYINERAFLLDKWAKF